MNKEKLKTKNTHVGADDPVRPFCEGITKKSVGVDAHIDPHYRGITLIALVITIIVLLILAGVAINLAIDSDGLFSKANQAGKEWNEAVTNEEEELGSLMQMLNSIGGSDTAGGDGEGEEPETPDTTNPTAPTAITEVTNTENAVEVKATGGTDSGSGVVGYKYSIDKTTWSETIAENENYTIEYAQTSTTELPSNWESSKVTTVVQEGTQIAPVPVGYSISGSSEENRISQGLVIYEREERVIPTIYAKTVDEAGNESEVFTLDNRETINQYVWIPVDDINDMVMCKKNGQAGENSATICDLEYSEVTGEITCNTHGYNTATELSLESTSANFIDTTGLAGRLYGVDRNTDSEEAPYINQTSMTFTDTSQSFSVNSGYREPDILTDTDYADGKSEYLEGIGISVPEGATEGTTVQDVFKEQLNEDYIEMAKSVAKYGGFYIARYEAGANGASKKNQLVLTAADSASGNYLAGNKWYGLYGVLRDNESVTKAEGTRIINTNIVSSHMVWRKYV